MTHHPTSNLENSTNSEVEVEVEELLPAEVMMALCRVFSGEVKRNSNLYLMGSRHSPLNALQNVRTHATLFTQYTVINYIFAECDIIFSHEIK